MLPPNFLTIPQIQHERHAGSKLIHLTALLEFVLRQYNPGVTGADEGREPKVGERVLADKHLFDNVKNVLWALRVRNSFAHVMEQVEFSERDHRNAVDYLIEAIGAVCAQPEIPRALVAEIYHDRDGDLRASQEAQERQRREAQAQAERDRRAADERARRRRADELKLEEARLRHAGRERELEARRASRRAAFSGLRKLVVLALLGIGVYALYPKLMTLYKGDKPGATVVRTAAELALKRVKEKRKLREYGALINQIDAAWRDGEIEFRQGNYRRAEEKYRQLIGLWDGLSAQVAESLSFEELQAEVNALRQSAQSAEAPRRAADAWNLAEELRRGAVTARKNGNMPEAKNLILQARQQYELAQATAMSQATIADETAPAIEGDATPAAQPESTPTSTPVVPPGPEKEPEPDESDEADDDAFPLSEKEFLHYVTRRVNPVLSRQARNAGVSGPVVIAVHVSKDGHLYKAWVVEGDMLLRESALSALRQWSFRPYHRDRVPTDIKSEITVYVR
jgi:hypothetical protein